MNPDDLKEAWQKQSTQARMAIDAERLMKQVQRNQQRFNAMIFWRDVREVGVALLMVPLWIYLGYQFALPWTWYLMVPAVVWVAGFMLVDRVRHKRRPPEPGAPLREHVEHSRAQVEHQTWLLRHIFWWYLLPLALASLAFFGHAAWQDGAGGWLSALSLAIVVIVEGLVFAGIYWLNQLAVRCTLAPRRQELEALLVSLKDETPAVSS
jgi:hypothetical protein